MAQVQRVFRFILFSRDKFSYVALALFGALPVISAAAVGVWRSVPLTVVERVKCADGPRDFIGMDAAFHWWIFPILLPLGLYLLRKTATQILGVSEDGQEFTPPSATLVPPPSCNRRRDELVQSAAHVRVFLGVLALVVALHVADTWDVARQYLATGNVRCPEELDWTVYFIGQNAPTTRLANLVPVLLAYGAQFIAAFFGFTIFTLFLIHNWFYLGLVYQRHDRSPKDSIVLDFDDDDDCFGQGRLHPTFNLQIVFLFVAGIFILVSRYQNVRRDTTANATKLLEEALSKATVTSILPSLGKWLNDLNMSQLFPDVGQVILAVSFILIFAIIAIPSLLKFLPFRRLRFFNNGMRPYLAEFLPPGPGDPMEMSKADLLDLAGKFARNSFWPAGDPKAERLFAFVYVVLMFIFVPIPFRPFGAFLVAAVLLMGAGVLLTLFTFMVYRYIIGYVGKPLVKIPKE